MTAAKIAYLGAGNMAQGMVRRLLGAGYAVRLHNRTLSKLQPLQQLGADIAATPREAASGCDIIFASVTDDAASRAIWTGPDGALSAATGKHPILVEHSTLSHAWAVELSGIARECGVRYVDCPVAGRPDAAASGQLLVFAGADAEDLETVAPYLRAISKEIFHFGPAGAGTAFKLIYNLMGVVQLVALAEGLAAAEVAGIDLRVAAQAFARGNTGSGHVARHGPVMAAGQHESPPAFTARNRVKDSTYGVKFEESLGENPRVGRAALAAFQRMLELGMGHAADTRVLDAIRQDRGPDIR